MNHMMTEKELEALRQALEAWRVELIRLGSITTPGERHMAMLRHGAVLQGAIDGGWWL